MWEKLGYIGDIFSGEKMVSGIYYKSGKIVATIDGKKKTFKNIQEFNKSLGLEIKEEELKSW